MELAEIGKNILTNCMNVKPGENVRKRSIPSTL